MTMNTIVIIGGGIAGLAAGIFAQANGFKSTILEKHRITGGECTGWNRKGYHIDGCIHWLVGTKEGTPMNQLWKSVGALEGVEIYHPETFMSFEHGEHTVHLYRDPDRLRSSWLALSPADEGAINEFCDSIKRLSSFDMDCGTPVDLMSPLERIRSLLSMKDAGAIMGKFGKIGLAEYARGFKHPALRALLETFAPESYAAAFVFFALSSFIKGQSSIPMGGSKALADRMAKRYLDLGGTIETSCEVVDVVVNGKRVSQLACADGRSFQADHYIAACDAHFVYENLLKGRYQDKAFFKRFEDSRTYPLASNTYIGLGYEGTMDGMPRSLRFPCTPIKMAGEDIDLITMNHYGYEPGFAPEGCTAITVALNHFGAAVDAWFALAKDPEAYRREKQRVGLAVLEAIEQQYPSMKGKLTLLDVATPASYQRYCNAYRGAFMAFFPTIGAKMMAHTGRIKGLDNFVLSGQWLQPPGGLPVAVVTGKDSIQRLCRKLKRPFKTLA
jgi:phytoene dehydrogenase-like protein